MEAPVPGMAALAAAAPIDLSRVPWSLFMAVASLALIYFLFRRRSDVFEDLGFSGREVALLCLGSIAGWAVNLPLAVLGGTYLAVNVGGTLVPLLLVAWWVRKGKLRLLPALVGTALVAAVAWRIVEFHPEAGIVARYPTFFLPVAVALVFGLVVSLRRPVTSVPVVYTSGTLGALIGADLLHVQDIRAHFVAAEESTIISIGGAGVFDMVFLAGTFAMALNLAVVVGFREAIPTTRVEAYPGPPATVRDGRRAWAHYQRLGAPNALERAYAGLALSDLALRSGDYGRSVRMSWFAVDALLQTDPVRAYMGNGVDPRLRTDVEALRREYLGARAAPCTLRVAGEANHAAKTLVAALAPRTGLPSQLEGVA